MGLEALALRWGVDGPVGAAFLLLVVAVGALYLQAAAYGARRDRRHRAWPRRRTACFFAGLAVLVVDLYSGLGTEADLRLSVHMLEHMVLWVVVAPLLAAGAPVRLAFYALSRDGRRTLAGWLHSRPVSALTSPVGSVSAFAIVVLVSHVPAVYGMALGNDYLHAFEHGLYLTTALLVWAPLIGADPLPHRPGPRGQLLCMAACMLPMVAIAVWLATASSAVYGHYQQLLGAAALHDQRLAATIMWAASLPAFAIPALSRVQLPAGRRREPIGSQRAAA